MNKHDTMRSLLEELRHARPLLLYGDAWVAQIEATLAMPDDAPQELANALLAACNGAMEDVQWYLRRARGAEQPRGESDDATTQ